MKKSSTFFDESPSESKQDLTAADYKKRLSTTKGDILDLKCIWEAKANFRNMFWIDNKKLLGVGPDDIKELDLNTCKENLFFNIRNSHISLIERACLWNNTLLFGSTFHGEHLLVFDAQNNYQLIKTIEMNPLHIMEMFISDNFLYMICFQREEKYLAKWNVDKDINMKYDAKKVLPQETMDYVFCDNWLFLLIMDNKESKILPISLGTFAESDRLLAIDIRELELKMFRAYKNLLYLVYFKKDKDGYNSAGSEILRVYKIETKNSSLYNLIYENDVPYCTYLAVHEYDDVYKFAYAKDDLIYVTFFKEKDAY